MKNLLFYLLAKYVFPSIKYVFSSISNKRMAKYVLPSIWDKLPRTTQKLMLRVKNPNPSLHNQIKTLAHLKALHTNFS